MSASTEIKKPTLRIIFSPSRTRDAAIAALAAVLFALSFPRAGAAWCAPLGAAALYWSWETASLKRSFAYGWFAGWIFFTITFWWWSTTIKDDVGILAYVAVMAGAALEALAIGAAGVLTVLARRRMPLAVVPLAAACAFTAFEWFRSIGVLGVPFGQLGTTQADTALKVLAAYVGTSGLTFVLCALGFYVADAVMRKTWKCLAAVCGFVIIATAAAWAGWPARGVLAPAIPVAAIQGNIKQSLKFRPGMVDEAIRRYTSMTKSAAMAQPKPRLIVWPETVIPESSGLNADAPSIVQFVGLARAAAATVVVGSIATDATGSYNTLFFFTPDGLRATYEKRQLVPFAEWFPGKNFLWWLPYIGKLNGGFGHGAVDGVYQTTAGLTVAPLICWESAFGDLAYNQIKNGAQVLLITTDDAWFGTSSGPYQHAQIAQMRAIESGDYVVRAAATGISGIIAPDGTWSARSALETQAIVRGFIGPPVGSVFSRIGPNAIVLALSTLLIALFTIPWKRTDAA
ncbi:MAG: apolipoprotein N-acyltransferase [Candidatus Eremiobacteraeota bacterium]|nr:apolipoprotein N-acyltransferase [Candidatus Eremiobacteraeota bacterium]